MTDGGAPFVAPYWGATPSGQGQWHFALWAPGLSVVELELEGARHAMEPDGQGVHRLDLPAQAGLSYRFHAEGLAFADPASRRQAEGVGGASVLVDPANLRRNRQPWQPLPFDAVVITEIHIGTFTPEGTFVAAAESADLAELARLGVTAIEIMPLGQFPGRQGWGYDSIHPHAPQSSYGSPEDLCRLVDRIHELGMMVYLDVVFNHFGPEGQVLEQVAPTFFRDDSSQWGRKIDFDQPAARAYFTECAAGWLFDYGFDGLRLDAIDQMDDAEDHGFLVALARSLRDRAEGRPIHLMTEDRRNITALHHPQAGLYDAEWNDDYHHALHALLTGEQASPYDEFARTPLEDLCLSLCDGFVLQGQPRPGAGPDGTRGEPSAHLPWSSFINFNLNHDQAGGRPQGRRLVSLIGHERALVAHALLLSAPFTPLMFMGEETGSEAEFPWFADYAEPLASQMRQDRAAQHSMIPAFAERAADPMDPETWARCQPYRALPAEAPAWRAETERLLALRREVLLPIWRSGRAGRPVAVGLGPAALHATWGCRAGQVHVALSFDGHCRFDLPEGVTPLYRMRDPSDGHPWFLLWTS